MGAPVIIDDGGSTRIKRVKTGKGEMDTIINVDALTHIHGPISAGSKGSVQDIGESEKFSKILIVWQDKEGNPGSQLIPAFTDVLISSHLDQSILVEKDGNGDLMLTLFSKTTEPVVEVKQHKKKLRYVVSNSGPIKTVEVDGTVVYDADSGDAENPADGSRTNIETPIVYTSVVIT